MRSLGAIVIAAAFASHAAALEPADFLAQRRCSDGSLPLVSHCGDAAPQRANDPMFWRRHDWPAPVGYQIEDAFARPDGTLETTWSYPPFGPFVAANGDGGEIYRIDGGIVTIAETQDGGKPGIQYFTGARCGGTGWIAFTAATPTGAWAETIARLAIERNPRDCSAHSRALTRWRLEPVAIPFIVFGAAATVTVPAVISEHYSAATIARSRAMERTFFGKGWGRLIWEAWVTSPGAADLSARCPGTPFSTPPAPGWRLADCRYATNIVKADGRLTGAAFGWPPD